MGLKDRKEKSGETFQAFFENGKSRRRA